MLSAILSLAAPAIFSSVPALAALGLPSFATSAIGGGIGSLLQGGDTEDALRGAALGGLGGFLGGKMAGAGAGGQNIAGGSMPSFASDGSLGLSGAASPNMFQGPPVPPVAGGFMSQLTRPEAIGAGLGGLAADAMMPPPKFRKKEEEDKEMPRGMPIKNTSIFPEMGYDAGILAQFVQEFGQDALQDLIQKVQSGEIPQVPSEGDGMVKGAGDGMDDMIPANLEGDQDVLLSDGEFVVPADVVSGIGNGSSDAGANKLEDMMDRVRELRTGGKTQPPDIPDEMMLPA